MSIKIRQKEENIICSVSEFIEEVVNWEINGAYPTAFRGQKYIKWNTKPKLFRDDVGLFNHEKAAIRDLISIHPDEFKNDKTAFDQLARMQHFGLPTRLLDVTKNPLVALFFSSEEHIIKGTPQDGKVQAFSFASKDQLYFDSDRVSCLSNLSNLTTAEKDNIKKIINYDKDEFNKDPAIERLLWFIGIEKPHFLPNIIPEHLLNPVYVIPKLNNRRIIAQSGAFIVYGLDKRARTNSKRQYLTISAEHKSEIRRQLDIVGINERTLFPELDRASSWISKAYLGLDA